MIASTTDALDSSDDEDVSNFLQRKYNEYGRDINTMLKKQQETKHDDQVSRTVDRNIRAELARAMESQKRGVQPTPHAFPDYELSRVSNVRPTADTAKPKPIMTGPSDVGVYTDPVFGLRIVHPLISSTAMQERMVGRKAVTITSIPAHLAHGDKSVDWAIAGVIVTKGSIMTSKKGSQYCIWKLSDLRTDMKQVSVFLFKSACKDLWKTAQGMVVAVLNPGVMDNDKAGDVTLSLDTAQRCMILGQSKDLGTCKSKKKNGEPCTAVVNKAACEFCVFHVKQEYGKMSSRNDLQSATSGRGLEALRNKVLGKSEVFYGGQSFSAVPAKKNTKLVAKDQQRMMSLSEYYQSPGGSNSGSANNATTPKTPTSTHSDPSTRKMASTIETNVQQRQRDLDRLQKLKEETARYELATSSSASSSPVRAPAPAAPEKFSKLTFSAQAKPSLQRDGFSMSLGSGSLTKQQADFNKAKALALLKKPIAASNPNFIKHRGTELGRKRAAEELAANDPTQLKRQKITADAEKFQKERIAAIIGAKSSHADLVTAKHEEAQSQYFDRLEKKEAMEEKMLGTFSVPCKAVQCLQCRYTAFSASDRCKQERHRLKVIDAEKRFFECKDCGKRTTTVHRMPKLTCTNCKGSRWQRSAMIKDRSAESAGEQLSIRGDEETFIGSLQSGGNLNLCVAAED